MMKKIKILYLAWTGDVGGVERVVTNLCSYLNKDKHDISVCYLKKYGLMADQINGHEVKKICVSMKSGFDILGAFRLFCLLRKNQYDILHVHTDNIVANIAVIMQRSKKIYHEHMVPFYYRPIKTLVFYKLIATFYDMIIVVSRYLESMVKPILVNKNQILLIMSNFIDVPDFRQDKMIGASKKIRIGYVGRLSTEKNPILFVEIAFLLQKKGRYSFVIFGEGHLRCEVKERLRHYGIGDKVLLNKYSNSIEEIMKNIDILILTSNTESFSIVSLEAAANQVLLIARDVGGVKELIRHGETGYLFDKALSASEAEEVIDRIINGPGLDKVIKNAYDYVKENFDIKKNIIKYELIYQKLVGNQNSSLNY